MIPSDPTAPSPATSENPAPTYFNRDLSWLAFNKRVLAMARDERTPPLERVKFLAITASNLDEFFMKRIGLQKLRADRGQAGSPNRPGDLPPQRVLDQSRAFVLELERGFQRGWREGIAPALAEHGITLIRAKDLTPREHESLRHWFLHEVFPLLTPLAVDPGHRFPFISNLSLNIGALVRPEKSPHAETRFARIKVPDVLPGFVRAEDVCGGAPDQSRYLPIHELITHNLRELFPGMEIISSMPFRVTRSAAVELDDDDVEDLLEHVEEELRMRRFAEPVRLETASDPDPRILGFISEALGLDADDHYMRDEPLAGLNLFGIAAIDRPELKDPPWTPVRPAALPTSETDIFAKIREHDILVHHPYESFSDSVERFIEAAATDPDVLAIKLTLYRTSRDSPFVDSLIRAAEEGKQVACLVELRARFDEEKNVTFARQLERAGVHVAYGVLGLKTHCKCSLVVRRERIDGRDALRAYAHLGTGNYHPQTAQLYTDTGLLTCDPEITEDAVRLFNMLTGLSSGQSYDRLLIAPEAMRDGFLRFIDKEIEHAKAGRHAHIIAKMNQLEDRRISEALYKASQAGVRIDLIVRGFCCLRPGVPGLSENIRIRSVIGRFLEHARIFYFANGSDDPLDGTFYISSADWMYRNLSNRVESACPVDDLHARARLWHILDTHRRDRVNAWDLTPEGEYVRAEPSQGAAEDSPERLGTFETLMRAAKQRD